MHLLGCYGHICRKNKNQPSGSGPAGLQVNYGQVKTENFKFEKWYELILRKILNRASGSGPVIVTKMGHLPLIFLALQLYGSYQSCFFPQGE